MSHTNSLGLAFLFFGPIICNPEVPLEVHRHIRHYASCKEQIKILRSEFDVDISRVGTRKFSQLPRQPDALGRCGRSPQHIRR